MKILNPLTGKDDDIARVLIMLASQENCDGDPYDQMADAADYIFYLEGLIKGMREGIENLKEKVSTLTHRSEEVQIDILFEMARLVRNTDGLFPTSWGEKAGRLLGRLRSLDEARYQTEVMDK